MAGKPSKQWHTWSEDKIHHLFQLYKARPFLWRRSHKDYMNREMKFAALNEISRKLDCSSDVVKQTWKAMRDNFRKETKLMNSTKSGRIRQKKKQWRFYDALKFISAEAITVDNNIDNIEETNISAQYESQPSPSTLNSVVEKKQKAKKRKKATKKSKVNAIFNKYLAELQREPDDIELFASSVAADLRNMRTNGASNTFIETCKLKIRRILLADIEESVNLIPVEIVHTNMEQDSESGLYKS